MIQQLSELERMALSPYREAMVQIEKEASLVLRGILASRGITGNVKLSPDMTHIEIEGIPPEGGQCSGSV